jgi:predicted lipoprotein with Yx(FWY)xxD motif
MKCRIARSGPGAGQRVALVLTAVSLLVTTPALAAVASTAGGQHDARPTVKAKPTVRIAQTPVGPLLVDGSGYTVYMFVRDKPRKDECRKIKNCEKDWPAVTTTVKPVAGPGAKQSLLGSIPYKGKLREVTYKGRPLHTYRFDASKGSVINIGNRQFGGAWYALNAKGGVVK